MRTLLIAAALAAAASLAACRVEDAVGDSIAWGTVVSVQEAEPGPVEENPKYDEHPLLPEAGREIVVQLDDGDAVTVTDNGTRRHEPGERVRLLKAEDDLLLL